MKTKKTVRYGSETIPYRAPLPCANIAEEYKLANSLSELKSEIKTGKRDTCICRLCRSFLENLCFI